MAPELVTQTTVVTLLVEMFLLQPAFHATLNTTSMSPIFCIFLGRALAQSILFLKVPQVGGKFCVDKLNNLFYRELPKTRIHPK